jgi:hypothetical protein
MPFNNPTRTSSARSNEAPGPAAGHGTDSEQGGRSARSNTSWMTGDVQYDAWHSALELQAISSSRGQSFVLKISPVYAAKAGPGISQLGEKKYNYDDSIFVIMKPEKLVIFLEFLKSFVNAELSSIAFETNDLGGKRILLDTAEVYYPADQEGSEAHIGGLAMCIETDATDRSEAKSIVFISRPKEYTYFDANSESVTVVVYEELLAVIAAIESFLHTYMIMGAIGALSKTERTQAPTGGSAQMPSRSVQVPPKRNGPIGNKPENESPTAIRSKMARNRTAPQSSANAATDSEVSSDDLSSILDDSEF